MPKNVKAKLGLPYERVTLLNGNGAARPWGVCEEGVGERFGSPLIHRFPEN